MTTQLAFPVAGQTGEKYPNERAHVETVIRGVAHRDGGVVSPNAVRRALAPGLPHGLVGSVYRRLRLQGHLVPVGHERSDDVKGGNAGKWHDTFRWVENPTTSQEQTA